ncbi:DUF3325 domain-containing protein [Sphingobium phenoxybenzoativorans]|uniref:DUF3325 domain-containing protein n=1 Tax=Sphingobium phenoxybenzoativorans TaxID=1592790 RepID=A0A975K8D1_9SPHN|nr:DUF3325 domain-containing protein [Sphingobium phenoxybenzoativorans]QUT06691.1 DUF3325 domain-containing protein [Sphingobium phenoxybenzoativorans]
MTASLISLLLALGGFAALSLSMQRHARQAEAQGWLPRRPVLRWIGWGFLASSFIRCIARPDWRPALVEWVGALGLAAGIVVLILIYRPRMLPFIPKAAMLLALLAMAAGRH